jgi:hypothetical protein
MKKKSQIVLFILIGMVIFVLILFIIFLRLRVIEKTSDSEIKKAAERNLDRNSIIYFVEDCLRQVSEKAVFIRIGPQGGYIDPEGNDTYGENGADNYLEVGGDKIPYYVFSGDTYIPTLTNITKKFANYVIVEFERCLDFKMYKKRGYDITKPEIDYVSSNFNFKILPVNINVSINPYDVIIRLHYPLEFKRKNEFLKISDFSTTIPVNLGTLYRNASNMAIDISALSSYNISEHCNEFNFNGLINIYYRDNQFIEFIDYSSRDKYYSTGFPFRFGVNGVNVVGNCTS